MKLDQSHINKHKAEAKSEGEKAALASLYEVIDALSNDVEKLQADTAKKIDFYTAATDLIRDKKIENCSLRRSRNCMLVIGAFMSLTVLFTFYFILLFPSQGVSIATMPDGAPVAFISASFISTFGLVAIILRGLLNSADSSEKSSLLPESIKSIVEIIKSDA